MPRWSETTTYEQLQAMTPAEQREHFQRSIVLDPSALPAQEQEILERMNAEMDAREAQWAAEAARRAS